MGGAKKQIGLTVFNIFLKSRHEISFIDSKVLKKGVHFTIVNNYVHVFLKKTVKIIKSLNNNLVCSKKFFKIKSIASTSEFSEIKPFLKGFGGNKACLPPNIITKIPKVINNYYDFFLGNGSVLFAVLHLKNIKRITIRNKIYAFEMNNDVLNVYITIQKSYKELHNFLKKYSVLYNLYDCLVYKKYIYLKVRCEYYNGNCSATEKAAIFIFLNKTCFRGTYTTSLSNAQFMVRFGKYKRPKIIIQLLELEKLSFLIKDVIFKRMDCDEAFKLPKCDDFVYLNPPYVHRTNVIKKRK